MRREKGTVYAPKSIDFTDSLPIAALGTDPLPAKDAARYDIATFCGLNP